LPITLWLNGSESAAVKASNNQVRFSGKSLVPELHSKFLISFKNLLFFNSNDGILKANLSESSEAKKFSPCLRLYFLHLKPDFRYSSLSFVKLREGKIIDKLVINRQNFAQTQVYV